MSNYPPGVTGNEPQITGEWPCSYCGGEGGWMDCDGGEVCPLCKGTGIYPEEAWPKSDAEKELATAIENAGFGKVTFDEDDDGFVTITTELKVIGEDVRFDD